jgi:hypothetical protein
MEDALRDGRFEGYQLSRSSYANSLYFATDIVSWTGSGVLGTHNNAPWVGHTVAPDGTRVRRVANETRLRKPERLRIRKKENPTHGDPYQDDPTDDESATESGMIGVRDNGGWASIKRGDRRNPDLVETFGQAPALSLLGADEPSSQASSATDRGNAGAAEDDHPAIPHELSPVAVEPQLRARHPETGEVFWFTPADVPSHLVHDSEGNPNGVVFAHFPTWEKDFARTWGSLGGLIPTMPGEDLGQALQRREIASYVRPWPPEEDSHGGKVRGPIFLIAHSFPHEVQLPIHTGKGMVGGLVSGGTFGVVLDRSASFQRVHSDNPRAPFVFIMCSAGAGDASKSLDEVLSDGRFETHRLSRRYANSSWFGMDIVQAAEEGYLGTDYNAGWVGHTDAPDGTRVRRVANETRLRKADRFRIRKEEYPTHGDPYQDDPTDDESADGGASGAAYVETFGPAPAQVEVETSGSALSLLGADEPSPQASSTTGHGNAGAAEDDHPAISHELSPVAVEPQLRARNKKNGEWFTFTSDQVESRLFHDSDGNPNMVSFIHRPPNDQGLVDKGADEGFAASWEGRGGLTRTMPGETMESALRRRNSSYDAVPAWVGENNHGGKIRGPIFIRTHAKRQTYTIPIRVGQDVVEGAVDGWTYGVVMDRSANFRLVYSDNPDAPLVFIACHAAAGDAADTLVMRLTNGGLGRSYQNTMYFGPDIVANSDKGHLGTHNNAPWVEYSRPVDGIRIRKKVKESRFSREERRAIRTLEYPRHGHPDHDDPTDDESSDGSAGA